MFPGSCSVFVGASLCFLSLQHFLVNVVPECLKDVFLELQRVELSGPPSVSHTGFIRVKI